ncbi:MAG: preprotein translocase subunit SecG [Candidatus Cloacimonas sp.]|nr:preprotein translocase subunit SecG [Candidatus Cloacimonadota bacterium]
MYILLLIIHVLISIALVLVILAQSSKGGALDGLVGGTASNMFGSHGASEFLDRWTKILGAIWVISSIILAMNVRTMSGPTGSKALKKLRSETATEVPVEGSGAVEIPVTPAPVEAAETD